MKSQYMYFLARAKLVQTAKLVRRSSKSLPAFFLLALMLLAPGCMTSLALHDARREPKAKPVVEQSAHTDDEKTPPQDSPKANYPFLLVTVPLDIATSPLQLLWFLYVYSVVEC